MTNKTLEQSAPNEFENLGAKKIKLEDSSQDFVGNCVNTKDDTFVNVCKKTVIILTSYSENSKKNHQKSKIL